MLAAERKIRLVELVKQHRVATVTALAAEFQVSEATIRRDLSEIEQEGFLKRTHGGVILDPSANHEPQVSQRLEEEKEQKARIGKAAAEMVQDGEHIILDSGTTTLYIAKNLVHRSNITVITNDINVAAELRDAKGVTVIVVGGILEPNSYMLNGMFALNALKTLHVQKYFLGTSAIHAKYGSTNTNVDVVEVKRAMIETAQEIIIVSDDTKIGKVTLHEVVPIKGIHKFITGKEASEVQLQGFRDAGVKVIQA
jgi:DeoR family fructose operon transcriptional repressor